VSDITPQDVSSGQGADPKYYLRVLIRRRWLIAAVFLMVVGGVSAWTLRQPKVYAAQTSVIIDVAAPKFLDKEVQDVNSDSYSNYWANREYYETQHKVITSRAVAERVVEKLGLQSDAAFLGVEKILDEKLRAETMRKMDATGKLQAMIKAEPVKDSRVTMIRVEDGDANRAALLANEVADAYISENLSGKLTITENASKWLEERRDTLEKQSKSSEVALYNFKRQSDVLTNTLESQQSIVAQRLTSISTALTEVQLKIAGLKARVETINAVQKNAGNDTRWAEALPAAMGNDFVTTAKKRLSEQNLKCAELRERYLEGMPKLAECVELSKAIEKELQRELNSIVSAAESELKESQAKERNLQAMLAAAKTDAFDVNKKLIEFDSLKRDADNDQRLYDLVFKRLKDIELSGLLRTSNVRILDAARPTMAPVRPILENNILIAILVGLLGGFGLALLLELLDSSIGSQADIEERLRVSFLGVVPRIQIEGPQPTDKPASASKDLYLFTHPKSTVAEACRAVRTNLLFMSPDKPFKTMLVTSSGPQEGKSTTVISLGIAMAQSGSRILLLDTDMRRPRLHKPFGVPNDTGVSSLVVSDSKLEDAVKTTEIPNLFVLPCGPIPPNPAELLHTRAFHDLIKRLSQQYDKIILDSPPIGAVADAVVLATQVDGVLMVLKAGATHRETARRAIRSLNDVKARVFGAILNDIDASKAKYGDYYGYGYGYTTYGYYYGEKKEEGASS
jgi:succinoglycan biosynthesis transport protein ExoP